ncbi:MAG: hypothetical protein IMZ73_10825 [Chloroflexi bacterium]|nr:hypothetical protein [Chloroflexota bacterium]
MEIGLKPRCTPGASVNRTDIGWRLDIPAGVRGAYRLAQLDDYSALSRRHFHHATPWTLSLHAKVSASNLPGTWGFGLWNDPFGFSLGFGGAAGRLPVLPNAAWFFHASPPNWLSFRDEIPAHGFFAGTINSPHVPPLLLAPALLALPFLALRPISRLLRKLAGQTVRQDAAEISVDVTKWHEYSIQWLRETTEFKLDGETILQTSISPVPPLGLVLWIDNQFAAWTSEGRLGYGTLDNQAAWLELKSFEKNG